MGATSAIWSPKHLKVADCRGLTAFGSSALFDRTILLLRHKSTGSQFPASPNSPTRDKFTALALASLSNSLPPGGTGFASLATVILSRREQGSSPD